MRRFSTKVVGVSHVPGYPDNILGVLRAATDTGDGFRAEAPPRLFLMADDDNPADDMAVMVVIDKGTVAGVELASYQLGFLPAPVAGRIRPDLEEWRIESYEVNVVPSRPGQPGVSVTCVRAA